MAYGATEEEALRKAKMLALKVLADMIENREELPDALGLILGASDPDCR